MEIQTTIKEFSTRIRNLGISPETPIRVIIDEHDKKKNQATKGKWAKISNIISEQSPLRGHSEKLIEASRDFRDNFRFRKPPNFNDIKL